MNSPTPVRCSQVPVDCELRSWSEVADTRPNTGKKISKEKKFHKVDRSQGDVQGIRNGE